MKNLISALTSTDYEQLEKKLKVEDPKLYKLYLHYNISDSDLNFREAGIESKPQFSKLKRKLEDHIFSHILSKNNDSYFSSEYIKNYINIKKAFILVKFAFSTKLYSIAKRILNKSLKNCDKYEMYHNAYEVCRNLLILSGIQRNKKEMYENIRLIELYHKKNNKFHESEIIYAKGIYYHQSTEISDFLDFCESNFPKLKKHMQKSGSTIINFMYYDLNVKYFIKKKNSKKSLKFVSKLTSLLEENEYMFSKKWVGYQKSHLAEICLYNGDYELGIKQVKDSLQLIKPNRYKYAQALETYYHLSINSGKLDLRDNILSQMRKVDIKSIDPFYNEKVKFYTASCMFLTNNKEKTLQILQGLKVLAKDKKGWGLGVKLLEIMTLFDLGMTELLDYKLHNFRMFIYNQKIQRNARLKAIYNCLRILRRNINLPKRKITVDIFKQHYINLKGNSHEYTWDPKSYETIRFEMWLVETYCK